MSFITITPWTNLVSLKSSSRRATISIIIVIICNLARKDSQNTIVHSPKTCHLLRWWFSACSAPQILLCRSGTWGMFHANAALAGTRFSYPVTCSRKTRIVIVFFWVKIPWEMFTTDHNNRLHQIFHHFQGPHQPDEQLWFPFSVFSQKDQSCSESGLLWIRPRWVQRVDPCSVLRLLIAG